MRFKKAILAVSVVACLGGTTMAFSPVASNCETIYNAPGAKLEFAQKIGAQLHKTVVITGYVCRGNNLTLRLAEPYAAGRIAKRSRFTAGVLLASSDCSKGGSHYHHRGCPQPVNAVAYDGRGRVLGYHVVYVFDDHGICSYGACPK